MKKLKDSIIELRKMNFNGKQISEKLHCASSTVSFHLKNEGLGGFIKKDNIFLSDLTDEIIKEIIFLRQNKMTFKEINNITKVSRDKISKICKIYNVPKVTKNGFATTTDEKIEKIKKDYIVLENLTQVAKQNNVSRGTVKKYVEYKSKNTLTTIERKKYIVQAVTKSRKKRKEELVQYKGGKCENCGYNKTNSALQFHHKNPDEKDFTIGGRNHSFEKMKKEVDKCILVCANCHCEIHEELRNLNYSNIVNKILNI